MRTNNPLFQLVPTGKSQDFARKISQGAGISAENMDIVRDALTFQSEIFDEVLRAFEFGPETIEFVPGIYFTGVAFIESENEVPCVRFDEAFSCWLFSLSYLICLATFKPLSEDDQDTFVKALRAALDVQSDPYRMLEDDFPVWKLVDQHTDVVQLAHLLERAMFVYVLCHELAHVRLNHPLDFESVDQEIAADRCAAEFFHRICGNRALFAGYVDPKLACAPVLFFELLTLSARRKRGTGGPSQTGSHPDPFERARVVEPIVMNGASEVAKRLRKDLAETIEDVLQQVDFARA